jgi:hypothetical protein
MKNIFLFSLMVVLTLSSCSKDEDPEPCNCGTIANDGIDYNSNTGQKCYWLEIRNNCSGNKKKFCFDEDVWMNNHVGSNFCVTGETSW